jgi:hypothetical protein
MGEHYNSKHWLALAQHYDKLMTIFKSEWRTGHAPKTYRFMQEIYYETRHTIPDHHGSLRHRLAQTTGARRWRRASTSPHPSTLVNTPPSCSLPLSTTGVIPPNNHNGKREEGENHGMPTKASTRSLYHGSLPPFFLTNPVFKNNNKVISDYGKKE